MLNVNINEKLELCDKLKRKRRFSCLLIRIFVSTKSKNAIHFDFRNTKQ